MAAVALAWSLAGQAADGPVPASGVTSISIERGCNGCPEASLLELRRDGHAALTIPGNARFGTVERRSHGSIDPVRFGELAAFGVAQGFFSLDALYEDAALRDGAWTIVSMEGAGGVKRVMARGDAAPESLQAIEAAVERARAAIDFRP